MAARRPARESGDTRPAVYGYLRTNDPDEDTVASLRVDVRVFCAGRDWRLVTVFCDRGSDGSETARPGFAAALDALALPDSMALVVPSLTHLSPDEAVRAVLASMVRRAGREWWCSTHGTTRRAVLRTQARRGDRRACVGDGFDRAAPRG
ncbi:MAG: recombinase family protein [Sciscionella sp.]